MSVDADLSPADRPKRGNESDERDDVAKAMRRLDKAQKVELIHFVDDRLASDADDKTLARVFDDGHTYIVWRTAGGPRRYLELIRDVAQTQT